MANPGETNTGPIPSDVGAMRWLWLSAIIVAVDQLTKWAILVRMELHDRIELLPVLGITRMHNTGAAFSFLADASGWQRWFFIILALVVTVLVAFWLKKLPARGKGWLAFGLALIVGGAVGNVIDRIAHGYVVDFISVHYKGWFYPAFNVADSAITVGAIILILDSIFEGRRGAADDD
ncbi:MAG: signal peptidase II [Gammaproteobacteria bacterium]